MILHAVPRPAHWQICGHCGAEIEHADVGLCWRDRDRRLNCRIPGNPLHYPGSALTDPTPVTSNPAGPTLGDLRTASVDALVAPVRRQLDEALDVIRAEAGDALVDAVVAMTRAAGGMRERELAAEWEHRAVWFSRLAGFEDDDRHTQAKVCSALSITHDLDQLRAVPVPPIDECPDCGRACGGLCHQGRTP
jgi:hypothetical protein